MKALVIGRDGNGAIQRIDRPDPASHQALVQTIAGGLCGTDRTLIQRAFKGVPAERYPLVLGHESVGRVVQVGANVASFDVGDVVLLPFVPAPTVNGQALGSAWGAFSEFALVDDPAAFESGKVLGTAPESAAAQSVLPKSVNPLEAPVLVTLREVLSSIKVSGIGIQAPIVLYGSGPVAMAFARLLSLLGAKQIIAVVRSEEKAALMRMFGAHLCINSTTTDVLSSVLEMIPSGVGGVIDAVGQRSIVNEAMGMLADRAIVFCYGVPKGSDMSLDWSCAPDNWTLNFQQMPRKEEEGACHQQVINWAERGDLRLYEFISNFVPFDRAIEVLPEYLDGRMDGKVILTF